MIGGRGFEVEIALPQSFSQLCSQGTCPGIRLPIPDEEYYSCSTSPPVVIDLIDQGSGLEDRFSHFPDSAVFGHF